MLYNLVYKCCIYSCMLQNIINRKVARYSNLYILAASDFKFQSACKSLGGLGPLIWEEIENEQTVLNPKLKFIHIYTYPVNFQTYSLVIKLFL
jgi:hypothetical protein